MCTVLMRDQLPYSEAAILIFLILIDIYFYFAISRFVSF